MKGSVRCNKRCCIVPSKYPKAKADVELPMDPFRSLEEPFRSDTLSYVSSQKLLAEEILEKCTSREEMKSRISNLLDYPKRTCPRRRSSERVFFMRNLGLEPQDTLCVGRLGKNEKGFLMLEEEEVIVDPTQLGGAISSFEASPAGDKVAYALAKGGSDWCEVRFMQLEGVTNRTNDLVDVLRHVKFTGLAWTHDGSAIVYNRYPAPRSVHSKEIHPEGLDDAQETSGAEVVDLGMETDSNRGQELVYHRLGDGQEEDIVLWKASGEEEEWMSTGEITEDGRYLVVTISHGCDPVNRLIVLDLMALDGNIKEGDLMHKGLYMVKTFDAQYEYVANEGPVFTFKTNLSAPRYKLVRVDLRDASTRSRPETWIDVVPQSDNVLKWAAAIKGDMMVCNYMVDVKDELEVRRLSDGELLSNLNLPIGSVASFSCRREDSDFFFKFQTFTEPGTIYRVDTSNGKIGQLEVFQSSILKDDAYNPSSLVTKQLYATSKDGTKIPMFITHHKDMKTDGNNLTMLYGYGGFNISLTPSYSAHQLAFILGFNGIAVTANLRGGGEYGEEWHKAGSLKNKQNVFDDFIACAEHLIENNYTCPSKLAIQGGSNGGLLVAACTNQRPDLFGCSIAHVGVMDMLRFHKFTIGHAWCSEYGCADNSEEELKTLLAYSPLHNVIIPEEGEGEYPAMMLLTGDHDDRVVPLHTLKLVATIQQKLQIADKGRNIPRNPVIARIETRTGHGAGKPTDKVIEQYADVYAFIGECLGGVD